MLKHASRRFDALAALHRNTRRRHLFVELLEHRLCLATVPPFSSLPGANHTIYLDFDGQTVTGTSWSGYYNQTTLIARPYNIDSDDANFSATELARIEEAWKRVAEDYRPFNVNVTTVDPGIEALRKSGGGDTQWGIRAVITNESTMLADPNEACGCGGIAYIDSFNWNSDTPVWVYTTGGKSIAEAASHEVGHSLGLAHDGLTGGAAYYSGHGSGETGWASIMGVGYYQNVTQWDRGEYYNSNNAGSNANYGDGPDDLAIIVGTAGPGNGFSYRSDDHGNTSATATALNTTGTSLSGSGIIERTMDVDVFSFATGNGQVNLNIAPFTPGPNVDLKAELYDSSGTLIATSNSDSVLSAGFSLDLPGGQYFVHVDGAGWGDPGSNSPSGYSDYASLGQYTINGSVVDPGGLIFVSAADAIAAENSAVINFTLTLSSPATQTTSVGWTTSNGSATAGQDYFAETGVATFQMGETTANVTVTLQDDTVYEGNEQFSISLSSPLGIAIGDGLGIGTITENDPLPPPTIRINDVSVNEGKFNSTGRNAGTAQLTNLVFTLTLSGASTLPITVNFATEDGSATTANNDYQVTSGSVTFSPGQTTNTVTVVVVGDNTQEPNETFTVKLTAPTNATLADEIGIGTIVDDDASGGGKGGGKPNRIDDESPMAVADPFWFFEAPDESHSFLDSHGHDHEHRTETSTAIQEELFASLGTDVPNSRVVLSGSPKGQWLNLNLRPREAILNLVAPQTPTRIVGEHDEPLSATEKEAGDEIADELSSFVAHIEWDVA